MDDHTDAEIARRAHDYEMSGETRSDAAWARWMKRAEAQAIEHGVFRKDFHPNTGSPLDGDGDTDGYSIDQAYDAWRAGYSPAAFIGQCVSRMLDLADKRQAAREAIAKATAA